MRPIFPQQELMYKVKNPKTGEITYKGFKTNQHLQDESRMIEDHITKTKPIKKRRRRNKIARKSRQENRR